MSFSCNCQTDGVHDTVYSLHCCKNVKLFSVSFCYIVLCSITGNYCSGGLKSVVSILRRFVNEDLYYVDPFSKNEVPAKISTNTICKV